MSDLLAPAQRRPSRAIEDIAERENDEHHASGEVLQVKYLLFILVLGGARPDNFAGGSVDSQEHEAVAPAI